MVVMIIIVIINISVAFFIIVIVIQICIAMTIAVALKLANYKHGRISCKVIVGSASVLINQSHVRSSLSICLPSPH